MKKSEKIVAVVLVVFLAGAAFAYFRTAESVKVVVPFGKSKSVASDTPLVDLTPLKLAQQLAPLGTDEQELSLAREALRLGDREVDLAYDAARHNAKIHPAVMTAQAKEAKDRVEKYEKVVQDNEATTKQLQDAIAKTSDPVRKEKLQEQLDDTEADRDLAEDELDDAEGDFQRSGGDLQERIDAAKKEHDEAQKQSAPPRITVSSAADQFGLIHRYKEWSELHTTKMLLWRAKSDAENRAASLAALHNALEAKLEAEKAKLPELEHHLKKGQASAATTPKQQTADKSAEELAASADRKWELAGEQEALSFYDKRIQANNDLAAVYAKWIDSVSARQRSVIHRALIGVLFVLAIALAGLFFESWMQRLVNRLTMDRRQVETLKTVTRVTMQVIAIAFILLVVVGLPGQLGTFLGLAGAGLTVALKDFIVGFIGWFVLMGKNGIRLGDWVEINGVTGEVVELGMFHTVLLETGNWTDSGHPTGRRVTFTNSYAIEGHYFNFSTSGQWLWDELQVVLPAGKDPYPVVDAIQKIVQGETAASARQAEEEWQRTARSRDMSSLTAAPAINVKPVIGGVEIAVRYITRANERYQLRAKLYQAAVDLLGAKSLPVPVAEAKPVQGN